MAAAAPMAAIRAAARAAVRPPAAMAICAKPAAAVASFHAAKATDKLATTISRRRAVLSKSVPLFASKYNAPAATVTTGAIPTIENDIAFNAVTSFTPAQTDKTCIAGTATFSRTWKLLAININPLPIFWEISYFESISPQNLIH